MGTRLALGASLRRLASQIAVENLLLSILGGVVGLGFAYILVSSLTTVGLDQFPRSTEVRVGPMTAAFGLAGAILTGLFIAAVSIVHVSRVSVSGALVDISRSSTASRRVSISRNGLVVAQIAIAFVLLNGSALLLASFRELLRVAPGFSTERILTASTLAPSARYAGGPELTSLTNRFLSEVRSIPGVVSAGATNAIPLQSLFNHNLILPEGYADNTSDRLVSPIQIVASDGYLEAMGIRLLAGRYFDQRDAASAQPVILIDRKLAEHFWPGQNAVGRRMYNLGAARSTRPDENTRWLTVIGVVETARMNSVARADDEPGAYYLPASQAPLRTLTLAIKTRMDPESVAPSVRAALTRIDPLLAMFDVQSMQQRVASSLASRRAALSLSLAFAVISLLLASVGLYAVLSYLFIQRRREMGVRMALGCTPGQAFCLFLRGGAALTGTGIVLGGAAALAARSVAEKLAYGVKPFDPVLLGFVVVTLCTVAFLATALPARQAARIDPATALAEQ
jgi:predicted permease